MRSKKIIFVALAFCALAGAGFMLSIWPRALHDPKGITMRVAFPYDRSPKDYDPANITLAPEYIFLENTFSPLIEMDVHGAVTSGVATRFEWVGDEAVLTIRKDLATVDGHPITPEDAEASLKRLLILAGNTHGNLRDLLCHGKKLMSLSDECPGIEVRGDQLILKPGRRKPFLFPMLTAIDFAVIPTRSFDPKTLAITDFRNTSGPYYVAGDAGGGHMTLKANPRHYHYSKQIPQEVRLVPMDRTKPGSSLQALEAGQVDVVTTIDAATPEDVLQFYKKHPSQYTLGATLDLRNIVLAFTERGRKLFTAEQRRMLGRAIRQEFLNSTASSLAYKPTVQYFPVFGEGGLSNEQLTTLDQAFKAAPESKLNGKGLKVHIVRLALRDEFTRILEKVLPGLTVVDGQVPAFIDYTKNPDDMPIFSIGGPDTGFLEDIGLISYSMNAGSFNIPKEQRPEWLATYGDLERKEDRISRLNQLHFDALMDPIIVPLAVAPYVALATSDWDIGLSKLFANNQLWLFKHK